jgi:hypothetical protein
MRAEQHPVATAPLCRVLLPKGFTGKGEAIRWRNDLIVAVAQVHAAMTTLHQATRAVRSRFVYLERYRRNQTGAVTLRWRRTTGRYVTCMLQPTVRQLPTELASGTRGQRCLVAERAGTSTAVCLGCRGCCTNGAPANAGTRWPGFINRARPRSMQR